MKSNEWNEKSDQAILQRKILALSESKDWEGAKTEWEINTIWYEKSACLCQHSINQNIEIVNIHNNNFAVVGNVCIFHFLGWDLSAVFSNLSAIKKNLDTPWNAALALWVGYKGWFNKYELPLAITHCTGALKTKKKLRDVSIRHAYNNRIIEKLTKSY